MTPEAKRSQAPTHFRWWDWPAVLLLLISLFTATGRLISTEWVDHLRLVQTLAFFGGIAGLLLGRSCFSSGLVIFFASAYGLFAVPWQLGLTLEHISEEALWSDRLIILGGRLLSTLGQLVRREPIQDPMLFLCSMACLFWLLGVYAGYNLVRHGDAWRVVLPSGLTLIMIHTSDPYVLRRTWYLAAYLALSLLLIARLTYLRLNARWQQTDTRVPPLAALDFSYVIVGVTALIILLAWAAPVVAESLPDAREMWQKVIRPWRERSDEIFASLRRQGGVITVADYYSDSFPLGRGRKLTDALVLAVQAPPGQAPGERYYWRARVYDHYADGQWSSTALTTTRTVEPSEFGLSDFDLSPSIGSSIDSSIDSLEGRREITFTFTSPIPRVTLYAAPQPLWVNRRVDVDLAQNPDGAVDLAALHAMPPLPAGESYSARSAIASVTISQLREAGADYPDWVVERYLKIPSTITPRMRELARQIAFGEETAYDVASSITDYLRTVIRYSETITGSVPAGQEPLDWFLFDLREGFCNYYASAEVILLRSVGIPARLAVGFSQGDQQLQSNTYLVRQQNAHAWVEVYFPGLGWIEFEPTASQNPIYRPLGLDFEEDDELYRPSGDTRDQWRDRLDRLEGMDEIYPEGGPLPTPSLTERLSSTYLIVVILICLVLLLGILIWRMRRNRGKGRTFPPAPVILEKSMLRLGLRPPKFLRRWAGWAALLPLARAYAEIDRALERLNLPLLPASTPAERAATLARALPPAADPVQRLLGEYQVTAYSPRFGNLHTAQEAARAIRRLSWRFRLRRLLKLPDSDKVC